MKIGILSDTHDRPDGIRGAIDIFAQNRVAIILHCGDWTKVEAVAELAATAKKANLEVKGVFGNNDRDVPAFLDLAVQTQNLTLTEGVLRMEVDGRKLAVYHGHHPATLRKLLLEPIDLLCLGHSHKPRYDRLDDKVIVNPGSTAFAIPRSKTWRPSVAIYDTGSHEAEFIYF